MRSIANRYVVARESNVVRVDFHRRPDPPAPRFPGAAALRRESSVIVDAHANHDPKTEVA